MNFILKAANNFFPYCHRGCSETTQLWWSNIWSGQSDALQTGWCCEEVMKMLVLPPGNNTQLLFHSVIWNTSFLTPNWLGINRLQPCLNPFLYLSSMQKFVLSLKQWLSPNFFCQARLSSVDFLIIKSTVFFHISPTSVASSPCNTYSAGWRPWF